MKIRVNLVMVRTWLSFSGNITLRRKPADFPRMLVYVKRLANGLEEAYSPAANARESGHAYLPPVLDKPGFWNSLLGQSSSYCGLRMRGPLLASAPTHPRWPGVWQSGKDTLSVTQIQMPIAWLGGRGRWLLAQRSSPLSPMHLQHHPCELLP
jgi:hypothetical protein